MQSRRTYRIVMMIACFVCAGLNAYRISTGIFEWLDVFLLVIFLIVGVVYLVSLVREKKAE